MLTWTQTQPPSGDLVHVNHWIATCGPLRVMVYTEENNENVWFMDLCCDSTASTVDAVVQKKTLLSFKGNAWPDHAAAKANARDRLLAKLSQWTAAAT